MVDIGPGNRYGLSFQHNAVCRMTRTVIIGNGVAGISCARRLRQLDVEESIAVISSESEYFFSRTALMYVYLGHLRWQDLEPYERKSWHQLGIERVLARVTQIDFRARNLQLDTGQTIGYDRLILATGSIPNRFGWPGEDLQGVCGFYSKQDLEYIEGLSPGIRRAVIVGGGLIGIELAEMFHSRNIPVTLLVREPEYWNSVLPVEEARMISAHLRKKGIDLRLGMQLREMEGDEDGRVCAVLTTEGERIECNFTGLTAGVRPNIDWLIGGPLETDRGILVDPFLQTNLPGVFAIGDCAQLRNPVEGRKPIEAVWYSGRKMGECLAINLAGRKAPYDPGIWFNSAKFFDIEYQVYGSVLPNPAPGTDSIFWQHPAGDRSIRIVYDSTSGSITGINLLGLRFRHEVCDKWLREGAQIEYVLSNIRLAFFDPEFFPDFAPPLLDAYLTKTGKQLRLHAAGKLAEVLRFLKS